MVSACPESSLSYHLHPTDAYGLAHEGMRGKVEGGFTIEETGEEFDTILGHNAKTKKSSLKWLKRENGTNYIVTLRDM